MDRNGYNESLFPARQCYICGRSGDLARHEIFHGARRSASKRYGCWVEVCPSCHRDLHQNPASYLWLQAEAQHLAMERHGWSVEEFRKVFGKNYI